MAELSAMTMAEKARDLAGTSGLKETLDVVVAMALESVECDFGSVTLVHDDGSVETAACSDPVVGQADELQYSFNEGPCLTAAENNGIYVIDDTSTDPRWPNWGPAVAQLGLRSVLSVHLFTGRTVLGALNLYATALRNYDEDEVATATVVAAHASVALARLRLETNLWRAVDARNLIGQAQGILMERFSIRPDQAFAVLRRHSQAENRKLHLIAAELVETGRLPVDELAR